MAKRSEICPNPLYLIRREQAIKRHLDPDAEFLAQHNQNQCYENRLCVSTEKSGCLNVSLVCR